MFPGPEEFSRVSLEVLSENSFSLPKGIRKKEKEPGLSIQQKMAAKEIPQDFPTSQEDIRGEFGQNRVRMLTNSNFNENLELVNQSSASLKGAKPVEFPNTELVLFYYSPFDLIIPVWSEVAMTSAMSYFSAINLSLEVRGKKYIAHILNNPQHKLYSILNKTFENTPFILLYVNGKVHSIYAGVMDTNELIKYSLSLVS